MGYNMRPLTQAEKEEFLKKIVKLRQQNQRANKRMLPDWFSAALQTSRKCGRYVYKWKFAKDGGVNNEN